MWNRFLLRILRKNPHAGDREDPSAIADHLLPLLHRLADSLEAHHHPEKARQVIAFMEKLAVNPAPLALEEDEAPGRLGRYEIVKPIGRGAVGTVYLARDPRIQRVLALKVLRFSRGLPPDELSSMKEAFFREAESAGRLSHPNIVTIYDADDSGGIAYIAMEFLDGVSLKAFTGKERRLSPAHVVRIGARIADTLDYAHRRGVFHRDIKPANIMILKNGAIKLTDFGMARLETVHDRRDQSPRGTPFYMSPEQFAGGLVDGRSDIFSLGITLFQLLTGEMPFQGDSAADLMKAVTLHTHADPRLYEPTLPPPLVATLSTCLEKEPGARHPSARHLAGELRGHFRNLKPHSVAEARRLQRSAAR